MGGLARRRWIRRGRVYAMRPQSYATRIAVQKAGERAGLASDCRMVRQCAGCPPSVRSRRRRQSAAALSRAVAGVLAADPACDNFPGAAE